MTKNKNKQPKRCNNPSTNGRESIEFSLDSHFHGNNIHYWFNFSKVPNIFKVIWH